MTASDGRPFFHVNTSMEPCSYKTHQQVGVEDTKLHILDLFHLHITRRTTYCENCDACSDAIDAAVTPRRTNQGFVDAQKGCRHVSAVGNLAQHAISVRRAAPCHPPGRWSRRTYPSSA